MLKATFTEKGKILSLQLKGHAGYAEVGKDIICSSASILAYTVAQFVMEAENKGDLVSHAEIRLDSGDTVISCEPTEDAMSSIQSVYSFAKMGYALLAHNYPQYVQLNMFGKA
jgi:uncharacterized protein YsxB (DUF464 family)